MSDLHDIFEQKKIESEFQNRDSTPDGIHAEYDSLLREYFAINKKLKSFNRQASQLEARLRLIQKNFYDDMKIIDEDYKAYDGEIFPWRSQEQFTRNQYEYWHVKPSYLELDESPIMDVAIRKEGYDKQIAVLNNICRRIMNLDDMAKTLTARKKDLKNELNTVYGQFPSDHPTN